MPLSELFVYSLNFFFSEVRDVAVCIMAETCGDSKTAQHGKEINLDGEYHLSKKWYYKEVVVVIEQCYTISGIKYLRRHNFLEYSI